MSRVPGLAARSKPDESAKQARIRRNAWILGAVVIFFYCGVIALNLLRGFASSGAY